MHIRPTHTHDLPVIQDIERAAGERFRDIGMPEIADDAPLPLTRLAEYQAAVLAFVAADKHDEPVGYLVADALEDSLHIEQVSVHPSNARRGIGRSLLVHVVTHATNHNLHALTLTTFAHVPWNAPSYRSCGFEPMEEHLRTPQLRAIQQRENRPSLNRWPRLVMRRLM